MNTIDFFQGVVLARIIGEKSATLKKYSNNNSSFIIDDDIVIYIKYSQKRIKPWSFSFSDLHVEEMVSIEKKYPKLLVVLVCNDNGICCLDYKEFSTVISVESAVFPKWIKATRSKGEKYSVTGSDGKLKHKIGDSDFPNKIYF